MNVRLYQDSDYASVVSWWLGHNFPPPGKKNLPKTGFFVDGVCACFLYKTDSALGWLEFIVANPRSAKEERAEALDKMLTMAAKHAKEEGISALFSSTHHPALLARLEKHEFKITDTNVTHIVRVI